MKLIQISAIVLMTASAACTNSTRESQGVKDTDARGGSTTRTANPSATPGAAGGTNAGSTTGSANGATNGATTSGDGTGQNTTGGSH